MRTLDRWTTRVTPHTRPGCYSVGEAGVFYRARLRAPEAGPRPTARPAAPAPPPPDNGSQDARHAILAGLVAVATAGLWALAMYLGGAW